MLPEKPLEMQIRELRLEWDHCYYAIDVLQGRKSALAKRIAELEAIIEGISEPAMPDASRACTPEEEAKGERKLAQGRARYAAKKAEKGGYALPIAEPIKGDCVCSPVGACHVDCSLEPGHKGKCVKRTQVRGCPGIRPLLPAVRCEVCGGWIIRPILVKDAK